MLHAYISFFLLLNAVYVIRDCKIKIIENNNRYIDFVINALTKNISTNVAVTQKHMVVKVCVTS